MDRLTNQEPNLFLHGGNLDFAKQRFGSVTKWLDLSTGISPFAYPVPTITEQDWQRLPEVGAIVALRQAAADYFGIRSTANLTEAPGTQAILQRLPRLFPFKEVCVVSPTYSEHANCWRHAGAKVFEISDLDAIPPTAEAVVVVNPNNPDGNMYKPSELLDLAATMASRRGLLIVDEAFCDGVADKSVSSHVGMPGLLVLRSFGKFFGLAGVRLGFALGEAALIAEVTEELGPWAVSGPALRIGTAAYQDDQWIMNNTKRHENAAGRLGDLLSVHGLPAIGGTNLFLLISTPDAQKLWHHLASFGIWTRLFDYNTRWMRLGLPGPEQDWSQLKEALDHWSR